MQIIIVNRDIETASTIQEINEKLISLTIDDAAEFLLSDKHASDDVIIFNDAAGKNLSNETKITTFLNLFYDSAYHFYFYSECAERIIGMAKILSVKENRDILLESEPYV